MVGVRFAGHLQHHKIRGARPVRKPALCSLAPKGIGVSCVCPGLVKSYIYASDEIRPAELMEGAKPVNT